MLDDFVTNLPERLWLGMRNPAIKTLRDKFRSTCRKRKAAGTASLAASGIIEDVSDVDVLIGELMREKADEQEQRQRERHNAESNAEDLVKAGGQIRELTTAEAVRRTASVLSTQIVNVLYSRQKVRCEDKGMDE